MVHATACAPETPAAPHISVTDGQPTTTSLQVAQHFKKRHTNVLRAIRSLLQELPEGYRLNFEPIQIEVDLGRDRTRQEPAYRITRDGFMLLAMGFTGREALRWKLAYMDAFRPAADVLAKAEMLLKGALGVWQAEQADWAQLLISAHASANGVWQALQKDGRS